jgi:glyoxylase-like metal-dependent hydrolase (beta-lactamase superfamily II)
MENKDMHNSWIITKGLTDTVFLIQEPLRRLAPDYLTNTINMFCVFDKKEALIIDLGTGIYSIPDLIYSILGYRTTITPLITHNHWDHVGSLHEFEHALIHEEERKKLSEEENLEYIRLDVIERNDLVQHDISQPFLRKKFSGESLHVKNGEWLQVGGSIELQIIHLGGHTKGSIGVYYPDEKFIFVGDAFQNGYNYADNDPKEFLKTLHKLEEFKVGNYFMPAHEKLFLQEKDLDELIKIFSNIETRGDIIPIKNRYLDNLMLQGEKFSIILPRNFK